MDEVTTAIRHSGAPSNDIDRVTDAFIRFTNYLGQRELEKAKNQAVEKALNPVDFIPGLR
jgi:hypothetical protein